MKHLAILGSTGSIGTQTLDIVRKHPTEYTVEILVALNNYELLAQQAVEFNANAVVIGNEDYYASLKGLLSTTDVKVFAGEKAIQEVCMWDCVDVVVTAMVGFSGLKPTLAAIEASKTIALANKETLVVAGEHVMRLAAQKRSLILPVDSEHSAIFQCLQGEPGNAVEKLILTASGGPFRGQSREQLANVTAAQALKHPNWNMGAKVTIDSASMMNKGLETIEARWLFNMNPDDIEVVVHPQSIVHSMVQFTDGSVKAQLGVPDMRLPIQYALTWPYRLECPVRKLDWRQISSLDFEQVDRNVFRNLQIALDAMKRGGTEPCAMNGANEVVVRAFIQGKVGFLQMCDIISNVTAKCTFIQQPAIEDYWAVDEESRRLALEAIK